MTNVNISASEPQKPANPSSAPPQRPTQDNPSKQTDKPGEQQK
jgi:hypothetical protein